MAKNLLKNPCGRGNMEFWEVTENGGSEWRVEEMPGDCGHAFGDEAVKKYFATSYKLCLKKQVVDLLAEGFNPDVLDAQPAVTVEDWYCGRTDCGCTYQLTVSLFDANQKILQEFKPKDVTLDPNNEVCSWRQVTHTFTEYGPGLRFISFEHGGQDSNKWQGWYGVRVTGSVVIVHVPQQVKVLPSRAMAKNLLQNPCGEKNMEFWEVKDNDGSEWHVEKMPGTCGHAFGDEAVKKYFATSYELCLKKQVVDLLAEGYEPDVLDAQPAVTVEDWYCGRTDCGCTYQLAVSLLDENQKILQEFKLDNVTLDPKSDDCSWRQVTHTFTEYGPGLRFISFEHGGQDANGWEGWYGVRMTGSSVTIHA